MRRARAVAVGVAVVCAGGCELVTGFTGKPRLLEADGGGGSAMSASSNPSTASTAASSSGGTGGAAPIDGMIIVSGLNNPNSLAVDTLGIYWADADDGTIMQADFATGAPTTIVSGRNGPKGLAIDVGDPDTDRASLLPWVEPAAGNVMYGLAEASSPALSFATGQDAPAAVVVPYDPMGCASSPPACRYFWVTSGTGGAAGSVWAYILTPQNLGYVVGHGDKIAGVYNTSEETNTLVFSTDQGGGTLWLMNYSPAATTIPQTSLVASTPIAGLAMDSMFAYWSSGTAPGTVAKVSLAGGTPIVISPNEAAPTDVAVDALYVYWLDQGMTAGMGSVMKASLAGDMLPVVLASGQNTPRGLFLSGNNVYWISGTAGQGAIKYVAK